MDQAIPGASPSQPLCAACGAPVTGRFCAHCGAPTQLGPCPSCGADLAPGARFCHQCGKRVRRAASASRERKAWITAGIATAALLLVLLWRGGTFRPAPPPEMANPGSGAASASLAGSAPDISQMSPEERFDRLWNRVIRAADASDTATVRQFSPMALGAYDQLPAANADQRFHAALIRLAIADFADALALADTILAESPGHLFGYVIRGEAADRQNRLDVLEQNYREFLARYDAEVKLGRPEYEGHRPLLEDFRTRAAAGIRK
ncbi:MAG: zinc ribbon domain-containing protein [Gemmatimonadales bacterium]